MGPLRGYRILEFAGIGPTPFAGMMLADHGASVIRIDKLGGGAGAMGDSAKDILNRSRRAIGINLKNPDGIALVIELVEKCDALLEGYRPGVMERLGLGPDICLTRNPRLVYGRMTGWGQEGPLAQAAGHDINYIALSGALHAFGRVGDKPTPPINMVGDFGGGGMLLAFGIVCALLEAQKSGKGQIVDAAMVDGSALLMSMIWSFRAMGFWRDERGVNLLDTGAHFYDSYETKDGKYVALGAIEPQFYKEFLKYAGLSDDLDFAAQMNAGAWNGLKDRLANIFKTKTRDEWCALMEGSDACLAPVLSMADAPSHPHNVARRTFMEVEGVTQPAPAPRYSRSIMDKPFMTTPQHQDSSTILQEFGLSAQRIEALKITGTIK